MFRTSISYSPAARPRGNASVHAHSVADGVTSATSIVGPRARAQSSSASGSHQAKSGAANEYASVHGPGAAASQPRTVIEYGSPATGASAGASTTSTMLCADRR